MNINTTPKTIHTITLTAIATISILLNWMLMPAKAKSPLANPTPTVPPGLTYKEFEHRMDTAQNSSERKQYFNSIKGVRVHWIAEVKSISGSSLSVDLDQRSLWSIHLRGVTARQVPVGKTIEFEAEIDSYTYIFFLKSLFLKNVEIIRVGSKSEVPTTMPTNTTTPTASATATNTPTATPVANLFVGGSTNLRAGPGLNFPVIQKVDPGTPVTVYGRNQAGDWLLVDPNTGLWITAGGATLSAPVTAIPLAATLTPTSTRTPVPSATPRPTATPVQPIRLALIYAHVQSNTELQFTEYKREIVGKPVSEIVEIGNVNEKGDLLLHGDWSPFLINISEFCVIVRRTPRDLALKLDPGDRLFLEATIQGVVSNYAYYFNCEHTLVLTYNNHKPSD